MELALSLYPASLQALPSNNSGIKEIEHNRIKNPNWQEATSWLFTSVAEDLNSGRPRTNPANGQSGTRTRDRGLRVRRADHSATLPRPFASSSFVSCFTDEVRSVAYITLMRIRVPFPLPFRVFYLPYPSPKTSVRRSVAT